MELGELFNIQRDLNERIVKEHSLDAAKLRNKKFLALFTELGELANETRCFKYWSNKVPSEKSVILEEYVDCLHFILTIGIDNDLTNIDLNYEDEETDLTSNFIDLYLAVNELILCVTEDGYQTLLSNFLSLGRNLGFTLEEITNAYLEKNKENHKRQDTNY